MRRLHRSFATGMLAVGAMLSGCVEEPIHDDVPAASASAAEQAYNQGDFDRAAQQFLDASYSDPRNAAHYKLRAAEAYRENGELDGAAQALAGVKPQRFNPEENVRYALIDAEIALNQHAPQRALQALDFNYNDPSIRPALRVRALELRSRAFAANNDPINSARTRAELDRYLSGPDRTQNEQQIVTTLQQAPPETLRTLAASLPAGDPLRPLLDRRCVAPDSRCRKW